MVLQFFFLIPVGIDACHKYEGKIIIDIHAAFKAK